MVKKIISINNLQPLPIFNAHGINATMELSIFETHLNDAGYFRCGREAGQRGMTVLCVTVGNPNEDNKTKAHSGTLNTF